MKKSITITSKYNNLKEQIEKIENIFFNSNEIIHDARNQLKIVEIEGIKVVVKSFKIPNILNKIVYTFFKSSKARKSYENSVRLKELGIDTPEPIAYIENFKSGLLDRSFYISLYEPYDFTIREVFHHKVENHKEILKKFTQFTFDIHQKGIWHVDYSLGNILITKNESEYKFSLVDVNRMEFKEISTGEGLKNFNKFWAKDSIDLDIIAIEYANLSSFDEDVAKRVVKEEAQKIIDFKNRKKKLKKAVGK